MACVPRNANAPPLLSKATATLRVAVPQIAPRDDDNIAADTTTAPVLTIHVLQGRQASVGMSSQVNARSLLFVWPSVISLLSTGCPPDVTGCIVPVIIRITIKAMLGRRLRADMREERRKVVTPFRAHLNTPATVVHVLSLARIVTTQLRVSPSEVLWRNPGCRSSMSEVACNCFCSSHTPTTRRTASPQLPPQIVQVVLPHRSTGTAYLCPAKREETQNGEQTNGLRHATSLNHVRVSRQ